MPDLRLGRNDTALPTSGPQGSQLSWPKQVVLSSVIVILFGDPQGTSLSAVGLTNMWRVKTIYPSNKCLQSLAQCLALGTPEAEATTRPSGSFAALVREAVVNRVAQVAAMAKASENKDAASENKYTALAKRGFDLTGRSEKRVGGNKQRGARRSF